jgi:hypothetical protein
VVAGLDRLAGGSWLGVNDSGVVAAVMNRTGTLGPARNKRSRGELVLSALDHPDAAGAARALGDLDPRAYRPFNLLVADAMGAFWLRGTGGDLRVRAVPAGLHMLTAGELDDGEDPRIRSYLPRFRAAPAPDPDAEGWEGWQPLVASAEHPPEEPPTAAMCFALESGFGTLSSSLIALPRAPAASGPAFRWLFAAGPPDRTPFRTVPG